MAGTAALCEEHRGLHDGVEHADSYNFNPHKWMFTAFDCSAFWVRDRAALVRSLSVLPEYLRNQATESGTYVYSTVDGELVFHFNLNEQVHAITYAGKTVAPPDPPNPLPK